MKKRIVLNTITYVLIATFIVRLFTVDTNITSFVGIASSPVNPELTRFSLISIWLHYAALLFVIFNNFFDIKVLDRLTRITVLPIEICNLTCLRGIKTLYQGSNDITLYSVLYVVEILLVTGLSIYYMIRQYNNKNKDNVVSTKYKVKQVFATIGIFLLLLIPVLPGYFIQFMFGYGDPTLQIKELTFAHRVFIYIGIIVPFLLYFGLRNKTKDVSRFALTYISVGVLIGFMIHYSYKSFSTPWAWPFHLCNTALFILPICLIFKTKRLFYFTYFINVLGAFLAMAMPNYSAKSNIFSSQIIIFWYNHWIAFFMPLLCVALKQFKRPKIKEFKWSMIWFFVYFVLALFLNVYFSALGHEVDYFFINSDFIADKLGDWAENIFKQSVIINVGGHALTFHPLYQLLFFLGYVLLGLGMWFLYAEGFKIADSHYELHLKLKKIKLDKYAVMSAKHKEDSLMDTNCEAHLSLNHFSKKYATSKVYAVKDATLEVFPGEVFGFLGPNGAGKSTIIKSIVGIQPITEGSIDVCGFDVQSEPVAAKSNIGYVPDHYALYEKLTGREYINYIADIYGVGRQERNERIQKYIKIFELENSIDSKIKTYSHGMKQKITIISALVHNPKVWILDEPLTGLDPNSIYQVKKSMIEHAKEGNIVFFSSHLIDIVEKLCNRIAIIRFGQILCVKTLEEIEASGLTLEEFYLKTIDETESLEPITEGNK